MAYALGVAVAGSVWYFRRNRSTRPAVSTRRCLPVKYGWHWAHTSTWIEAAVERVSNLLPQAHWTMSLRYGRVQIGLHLVLLRLALSRSI